MQRHESWRGRHQLTGRGCVLPYMISSVSETAKHPQSTTSARERASTVSALNGRPGVLQLVKKRSAPSCLCARALQRPNAYFKHWTSLPNVIIAAQQHAWSQERRRRWSPPPHCHSGSGGSRQTPPLPTEQSPSHLCTTTKHPPGCPCRVFVALVHRLPMRRAKQALVFCPRLLRPTSIITTATPCPIPNTASDTCRPCSAHAVLPSSLSHPLWYACHAECRVEGCGRRAEPHRVSQIVITRSDPSPEQLLYLNIRHLR